MGYRPIHECQPQSPRYRATHLGRVAASAIAIAIAKAMLASSPASPAATPAPPPTAYRLIPLHLTNSVGDVAFKINNQGWISGTVDGPDGVSRGYLYSAGHETERGGSPGSKFTEWSGVGASGDLVGYHADPADPKAATYRAFVRRPDGSIQPIGWPGDTTSNFTVAINARGQIAGGSSLQGWVRNPDDSYILFETPGYQTSGAWGLNDSGIAVGTAFNGFFDKANGLIYDTRSNSFQIWNYPGAVATTLFDINNQGDIVGTYQTSVTSPETPFVRWADGTLQNLSFPDVSRTRVTGINDDRLLVGRYLDSDDMAHSFVATPLTGLAAVPIRRYTASRVDVPQAAHTIANAITDSGLIAGEWYNADYSVNEGFIRSADDRFTSIPPAETYGGITVFGINAAGDIAGFMESDAYVRRGTNFTVLVPPGAGESYARGINDAGVVVGDATGLDGNFNFLHDGTRFVLTEIPGALQSGFIDINRTGDILGYSIAEVITAGVTQQVRSDWVLRGTNRHNITFPQASLSALSAIADNGSVLGFFRHPSSGRQDRFFVQESGALTEIEFRGPLGGNRYAAGDMNSAGVIVGNFRTPDGAYHGFRAVPNATQDRLLIPSQFAGEILQYGPQGSEGIFAGEGLREPGAIVAGPDGNLYVSDYKRSVVLRYAPDGRSLGVVASQDLAAPLGMVFDPAGNLYVVSYAGNHVTRIAPDGSRSRFISQGLDGPVAILRDPQGNFLVSNSVGNNVRRYSTTGADLGILTTNVVTPIGLAFDSANVLHVASAGRNTIDRFDTNGVHRGVFASRNLAGPTGIAFARNGDLYVANASSGTVRAFSSTGFDLGATGTGFNFPYLIAVVPTLPVLTQGHADVGIDYAEGSWNLHLHDEENDIEYAPDAAVVLLTAASRKTIPADSRFAFLGAAGEPVWLIPQTADEAIVYLGLAADGIAPGVLKNDTLRVTLESVEGPGHFALYALKGFGNPVVYMNSRDGISTDADFRDLPTGGHEHLNWAFTAPGSYTLRVRASGVLAATGERIESPTATYRFRVLPGTPPPPLPAFTFERVHIPGATETTVADIDNDGTLVGRFRDAAGLGHGFVRQGTNLVTLNVTGHTATFAAGRNAAGAIAGFYRNATNAEIQHGFLRAPDGTITTVDGAVPGTTYLWRVNQAGQANGYWFEQDPFFIRSFLRDTNGTLTTLVFPGSPVGTVTRGLNDAGVLTGWKWDDQFALQGVVIEGTNFTQVFTIPGWENTLPGDINNHGDIAGTVNIAFQKTAGFFRRADGASVTFQPPGATSVEVFGLNDHGHVVGEYTVAGGQRFGFVARPATGLREGHVDVGLAYEDENLHFHVHAEDPEEELEPDRAVLFVGEAAEAEIPDTLAFRFLGSPGRSAWILPTSEKANLLFLGLGTEEIPAGLLRDDRLALELIGVTGPGDVAGYSVDGFGAVTIHWNSADGLSATDRLLLAVGSHSHVNWAFNAAGTYELRFRATGQTREGGRSLSTEATYTFVVPEPRRPQPELAPRPAYTFTAIQVPGATNTLAFGITDDLRVVGRSGGDHGGQGFLRNAAGVFETLNVPGSTFTEAFDIDAAGRVVGWFKDANRTAGFHRDTNGVFHPIELPGTSSTIILAANDAGWTAGFFTNNVGERGFLRDPSGSLTPIDPPGAINTQPYGLNNAGVVVGYFATGTAEHGFIRGTNGIIELYDPPGSTASGVLGINDSGAIAGYFANEQGIHGYVRTAAGAVHTLDYPGAHSTVALGLNNHGDVVGYWEDAVGRRSGFLARPAPRIQHGHTDLGLVFHNNSLSWEIHSEALGQHFRPEQAVLDVPARALTQVPGGAAYAFLGQPGAPVWILPQTSDPNLLFLGLAAEEVPAELFRDNRLALTLESFDGPGHFSVFTVGGFGTPEKLLDTSDGIDTRDVAYLVAGSHGHVNWAFTAPGIYRLGLKGTGVLNATGQGLETRSTLTFEVTGASARLAVSRATHGELTLALPTEPDVLYQLESAPDIRGPWTASGQPFVGTGRNKSISLTPDAASAVFRIRAGSSSAGAATQP